MKAATAKALGGKVPILQTIFSPLTTARKLGTEKLFADMRCYISSGSTLF